MPARSAEPAPAAPPPRAAVERDFARLWASLEAIADDGDRRVALDCVRDALDRGAARLPTEADILAGTYAVEGVLGAGSANVIFRCRHRDLGHARAVKTLLAGRRGDPLLRRLFLQEAAHHLAIRHDAVVEAETLIRLEDGSPALVMALVEGPTLAERLASKPLDAASVAALGRRLAEGFAAIHAAGVVHCDLTPANVLLPDGDVLRAQICDFGLSAPVGAVRADPDLAEAATPGFAAPELLDPSYPVDGRTDLFSLGALLLRALGGGESDSLAAELLRLTAHDPTARSTDALAAGRALARASCEARAA